jgi:type II secretory pathway predicted ATPase ExeA
MTDTGERPFLPKGGERAFPWLGGPFREALEALRAAVQLDEGLLLLTGDVGTGKTSLTRALLHILRHEGALVGSVVYPCLEPFEFMRAVALAFGLRAWFSTREAFQSELDGFLRQAAAKGAHVLVVVDEAQSLTPEVLDEISRLLRRPDELPPTGLAPLNALLVGQQELESMLDDQRHTALAARARTRCRLRPLTEEEVDRYVIHEVAMVSGREHPFTPAATREIHRASQGVPRLITRIAREVIAAPAAGLPVKVPQGPDRRSSAPVVDLDAIRRAAEHLLSDHAASGRRQAGDTGWVSSRRPVVVARDLVASVAASLGTSLRGIARSSARPAVALHGACRRVRWMLHGRLVAWRRWLVETRRHLPSARRAVIVAAVILVSVGLTAQRVVRQREPASSGERSGTARVERASVPTHAIPEPLSNARPGPAAGAGPADPGRRESDSHEALGGAEPELHGKAPASDAPARSSAEVTEMQTRAEAPKLAQTPNLPKASIGVDSETPGSARQPTRPSTLSTTSTERSSGTARTPGPPRSATGTTVRQRDERRQERPTASAPQRPTAEVDDGAPDPAGIIDWLLKERSGRP